MSTKLTVMVPQLIATDETPVPSTPAADWTLAPDGAHEYKIRDYTPPPIGPQMWSSSGASSSYYNRTDWVVTGWPGFNGYPIYCSLSHPEGGFLFHTNFWTEQWVTTNMEVVFSSSAGYNGCGTGSGLVNGRPWWTWTNWDQSSCEMKVSWTGSRWECTFNQNVGGHTIGEVFDYHATSTDMFMPTSGWNAGSTVDVITHYDYLYTLETTSLEPTGAWALFPEGPGSPPTFIKL